MPQSRPLIIAVTVCALAAMLALSMLPAEHLHVSSESGHQVVHRHASDDADAHDGSSFDHSEPGSVTILEPTFVSERRYAGDRPLITVDLVVVEPTRSVIGPMAAVDILKAHGPPIRAGSPRAPPS